MSVSDKRQQEMQTKCDSTQVPLAEGAESETDINNPSLFREREIENGKAVKQRQRGQQVCQSRAAASSAGIAIKCEYCRRQSLFD